MDIYRLGSKGEGVRQIQKSLKVMADGIFGTITEEAVKMFQATHGLTVDGIVGPATLARLIPVRLKKSKRHINEVISIARPRRKAGTTRLTIFVNGIGSAGGATSGITT